MTTITATTILSSQHAQVPEKRVTTLLLRYPRCIHAEMLTHRTLSRNSASSRAIPVEKLIADVEADPFVPLFWGKNQKGMQAVEEEDSLVVIPDDEGGFFEGAAPREDAWLAAKDKAVAFARSFAAANYHKQIVNRLLEPFAHITVVTTATEWQNFLALRDHPDAEPHIQILAREVRKELDKPAMQVLQPGQWHLPFVTSEDPIDVNNTDDLANALALSVARCASTSYKTVDGFDMTLERALDLCDKLTKSRPMHASPFEHQCFADDLPDYGWRMPSLHGNFVGFCQYRKTLANESVPG